MRMVMRMVIGSHVLHFYFQSYWIAINRRQVG